MFYVSVIDTINYLLCFLNSIFSVWTHGWHWSCVGSFFLFFCTAYSLLVLISELCLLFEFFVGLNFMSLWFFHSIQKRQWINQTKLQRFWWAVVSRDGCHRRWILAIIQITCALICVLLLSLSLSGYWLKLELKWF